MSEEDLLEIAHQRGWDEGYEAGREDAYNDGYDAGYDAAEDEEEDNREYALQEAETDGKVAIIARIRLLAFARVKGVDQALADAIGDWLEEEYL